MLELEDRENLKFSDEIRECSSHSLGKVSLCVCVFVFIGNEKGIGISPCASHPMLLAKEGGNMCMFCPSLFFFIYFFLFFFFF